MKDVDVVLVGLGLTGGILAKELAEAGLKVVGLERGFKRDTNPDFAVPQIRDELRYFQRTEMMMDTARETITFRHGPKEVALPMRRLGAFLPGEGVGGTAMHWGGVTWRWLPNRDLRIRSFYSSISARHSFRPTPIQDWITHEELEPHLTGSAPSPSRESGQHQGQIQRGQPRGPRQRDPLPRP